MTMRRLLLGAVCVLGTCGAVPAAPPLAEGRELDPVAREHYLAAQKHEPEGSALANSAERTSGTFSPALLAMVEAVLRGWTMPLGTAPR